MISDKDMAARSHRLRALLQQKLGVKGRDLSQSLRHAGRRLPRGLRNRGAALLRAEALARNPKTARQVDATAVQRDYEAMRQYLEGLDVAHMRRTRLLSVTAAVAANVLAVMVLFVAWLWWRGYV